jgi:general secretion pathway protein D
VANSKHRLRASVARPLLTAAGFAVAWAVSDGARVSAQQNQARPAPAPDNSVVGVASREAAKRQDEIRVAQELFTDAELDRRNGDNQSAVGKYRTAYLATPDAPAAAPMKDSIFKRYQAGTIAYADQLANGAKFAEAEAALLQLMKDARDSGVPAGDIDPQVKTLLGRLKSNDYYNKALSPRHLENVSAVELALKEADGFIGIGDLTKARTRYLTVLNVDRYNTAARRGLEKVDRMISEYEEVARNQTRSTMLRQVAEGWESPVPPTARGAGFQVEVVAAASSQQAALKDKMNRMTVAQVEFSATPLQTVVEYLTQISQDLDRAETDPTKRGVNIVVDPKSVTNAAEVMQRPVTLKLANAPFEVVLKYATQQAQMKYRIDAYAISIVPLSSADDKELVARTYQVPPGFISGNAAGAAPGAAAGGAPDPFAAAPAAAAGGATLVRRVSAEEFLKQSGVNFPPGSTASFNPVNSTLIVRNTPDALNLIEQMILNAKSGGAKQVMVEFKLIETTDRILSELGFDWLLGQFNIPGSGGVFAGGGTAGNRAGERAPTDFPFVQPGAGAPVGTFPLTSGLRSGNLARSVSSIDDVIARDSVSGPGPQVAPGVLGIAGAFTDPQFQVVLRALAQNTGNDILNKASVLTKSGQKAVIKQVREFIYPTEYDPPELPSATGSTSGTGFVVTPATPAAFETRELGHILEVEPTIGPDNFTVDLNLLTDLTEFTGFINYGSPINDMGFSDPPVVVSENRILMPVFDAIKETTQVTIYDGQTVAIGGLLGETVHKTQDKVPVLGDSPVIGPLFRSDVSERSRRALVLFATVRILDPAGVPVNHLDQAGFPEGAAVSAPPVAAAAAPAAMAPVAPN